ncbi:MAG: GNAT family N-acetyltransferase [Candidatus Sericytochromatia bacterium]|nr:GNAT family N-acetyltransferase [Candidatus Tanganyikabacteria bacterium]
MPGGSSRTALRGGSGGRPPPEEALITHFELSLSRVRPWRLADKPALLRYADNPRVSRALADRFPYPYTPADADMWLGMASAEDPVCNFAIEVGGEAIGGIGVEVLEAERRAGAEIGYWLGEPFWGRGIASEALVAVAGYAFERFDIVRLQAGVYSSNPASARVLEKAGFVREATMRWAIIKRGEIHDLWMYARLRP